MNQRTIKKQFFIEGKGLHKGKRCKITFLPAKENTGILIRNNGVEYNPVVNYVIETKRGTTLRYKNSIIYTVEHILSAIKGMDVDNIILEIDGDEPPALDGSSFVYCSMIKRAGLIQQNFPKKFFFVNRPHYIKQNDAVLIVLPYDCFKIYYFSDYSEYNIKPQEFSLVLTQDSYLKKIAKARTFGFKSEINWLYKAGLIKGADFKNAVLIDKGKPVNTKFRFKDEITRHKILDLIGDFALLPGTLKMLVIAVKTGHKHNIQMVKELLRV